MIQLYPYDGPWHRVTGRSEDGKLVLTACGLRAFLERRARPARGAARCGKCA